MTLSSRLALMAYITESLEVRPSEGELWIISERNLVIDLCRFSPPPASKTFLAQEMDLAVSTGKTEPSIGVPDVLHITALASVFGSCEGTSSSHPGEPLYAYDGSSVAEC